MLRHHGDRGRYDHVLVGGNFRLEAIQAAVLLVKLKHLDDWIEKRQANAARYNRLFTEAGLVPEHVHLPVERPGRHTYNQYVVEVERRDELSAFLTARGIGHSIYYPKPLHLQPCFESLGYKRGDFPAAERACTRVLALPIYPELPEPDAARVVEGVAEFFLQR
jgi:dTDP-4-amino-4,6-dideoxygalactose transaminase